MIAKVSRKPIGRESDKRVQLGYGLNYLIDTEKAVIVDFEATLARTYDEVRATWTCSFAPSGSWASSIEKSIYFFRSIYFLA